MLRGRTVLLVGWCAVTLLGLSSCGGNDNGDEVIAEVTTTTTAPTTEAESASDSSSAETTAAETTTTQAPAASDGADNAEAALRQYIEARSLGQHGRAWDLTLPAQRALLDRDAFFSCFGDGPSVEVGRVEVVDSYPERIPVGGLGEQDAMAFTLKLSLTLNGEQITDTDTYHALTENGRWYVTLNDETFACAEA